MPDSIRLTVTKTYKMFVGGSFIRSERGYVLDQTDHQGNFVAHYPKASRKDLRNAVVAARASQPGWANRTAFNRSQILFRLAEMVEGRRTVFKNGLVTLSGVSEKEAQWEVTRAIDRIFYYSGWADKYTQVLGSVNPVAAPYFNFTVPEPSGVACVFPGQNAPFLALISAVLPALVAGNSVVAVCTGQASVLALELGEGLATSDFPEGVVNILTGVHDDLLPHAGHHRDIDCITAWGLLDEQRAALQRAGADNMKRVTVYDDVVRREWGSKKMENVYQMLPYIEFKTAWHPIGM